MHQRRCGGPFEGRTRASSSSVSPSNFARRAPQPQEHCIPCSRRETRAGARRPGGLGWSGPPRTSLSAGKGHSPCSARPIPERRQATSLFSRADQTSVIKIRSRKCGSAFSSGHLQCLPGGAGDRRALDCGEGVLERGGTAQPRPQLKASAAQIRVIARARLSETPPTRVPTRGEREMKHVQVPPDGEVLLLDPTPTDDDPLLPHRTPPRFGSCSPLPAPQHGRCRL
jgi:hypothetical protein